MPDRIELAYHGDDPDRHVLDLYDAGRALYGAARFIYTLENFRVSGGIVEHATSARAKFELLPARPGSFIFDIQQIAAAVGPEGATRMLSAPLSAMVAWITKKITGDKPQEVDPALKQAAEIEREKTMQVALTSMRDVALRAIEASETSQERQTTLIAQHEQVLATIPENRVRALSSKLRPSLIDMARPTTSGAAYMSSSMNGGEPVLYMDEKIAESLKGNQIDDLAELTSAKFIQYNVETGWGKVRISWRTAPYRFMVHPVLRPTANPEILASMDQQKPVWVWFYMVRDKSGTVSYLLFSKFATEAEIPPP
jgi:hypothetical protein